jgi:hypothetical protein
MLEEIDMILSQEMIDAMTLLSDSSGIIKCPPSCT